MAQKDSVGQAQSPRSPRMTRNRAFSWPVLVVGVAVVLLASAMAFVLLLRPAGSSPAHTNPSSLEDHPALGPASAPVTIVEYGDFGCPTCRAWHQSGVLKQIQARYGDQVRFVWRDFPIITPQSPKAAEAGRCAYDQGKFWEYHDLLYARQPALSLSDLKSYAAELGLNRAIFNQCLDSGQHASAVNADLQDAQAHHFLGTPSFLVNDKPVVGPPSFEYFQSLIDPILASRG